MRGCLLHVLLFSVALSFATNPCNLRKVNSPDGDGFVCVCNATYCDTFDDFKILPKQVITYTSSAGGYRFRSARYDYHNPKKLNVNSVATVSINTTQKLQTVKGFGAAFTDSAGINLLKLVSEAQEKLLEAYFDPIKGLGYTIGRVPIGSTDFSTHVYSYDEHDKDFELKNFKLVDEDFKLKISIIKRAQKFVNSLSLFGSPWSPPAWMKSAKKQQGSSGLIGNINGPYYAAWALYFNKFLKEYQRQNISFWAVTIQNEPTGCYGWQCLLLDANQEAKFVTRHLRSAIDNGGFKDVKIIVNDDDRLVLPAVTHAFAADREAAKLIDGFGTHWYSKSSFDPLKQAHKIFTNKFILSTENLNAWAVGWVDWNYCLDELGGPNWANNTVDAPIITNSTEFYKQPMFYVLGHFSRFLLPDSYIVSTAVKNGKNIETIGGKTPAGDNVLIVLNNNNNSQFLKIVDVILKEDFTLKLEADSITTVIWKTFPKKL